jgi:NhaP-type Na+/H+ or K+/H+ antiporter
VSDIVLVGFGLVAVVLIVGGLASGIIERSPISFGLLFLLLGIGLHHAAILEVDAHSPLLEAVGNLTLAFVLFLDATQLQVPQLGRRWLVPAMVLGPGTAVIVLLGALPLALLVGFDWTIAFIGAAVLASTDPVLLREILRDDRIPRSVRQVLRIEAGMNDIVVLPIILVLIAVAQAEVAGFGAWLEFLARLVLVGPLIGFAVGAGGSRLMGLVNRRTPIRDEHQALYGIGLVLASYTAATLAGGDGFLGAFAAGLAVARLNQWLCACFLDFGETTAEASMLLAFVLFGAAFAATVGGIELWPALALAALVVFVIRPLALAPLLAFSEMSWEARGLLAWLGPRGISSLLLALLVVHAGLAAGVELLATVGVVVLFSAAIHGASAPFLVAWYDRRLADHTLAEEREATAAGLFASAAGEDEVARVTVEELAEALEGPNPPVVLDVRSRANYDSDAARIAGDVRVVPEQIDEWANGWEGGRPVVAYCT